MGMGAQNIEARLAASVGQLEDPVAPDFLLSTKFIPIFERFLNK